MNNSFEVNPVILLTIVFVGLKLADFIDWSWWWVLSPPVIFFVLGSAVIFLRLFIQEYKKVVK